MHRRDFLGFSAGASLAALSGSAWAVSAGGAPKRLVVVLLRGAADGLNVVVPYGEEAYYAARPTIAIAKPGAEEGALAARRAFRPASRARRADAAVAGKTARFCARRRLARPDALAFRRAALHRKWDTRYTWDSRWLDEPPPRGDARSVA